MKIPDDKYFEHPIVNPRYLKKNYPEFYEHLRSSYPFISSISEALWLWRNHLSSPPVCPVCGGKVRFWNISHGYYTCCSSKCSNNYNKEKREGTCLKKYGFTNPQKNKEIRQKTIETNLSRYGESNPSKSQAVKDRIVSTNLSLYGYEHPVQSLSIQEKIKSTFSSNHPGYSSPLQLPQTKANRESARTASIKSQHPDVIDIQRDGCIYTCSCPHPGCDKCIEKTYSISSRMYFDRRIDGTESCTRLLPPQSDRGQGTSIELFVRRLLDENGISYETNVRSIIPPREVDIYIPSHRIAIECNGCYWYGDGMKNMRYHYKKWKECEEKGVQLLTVWEDWIVNKPEIVKSIILSKLGVYEERIYARKCKVHEINSKECNTFLQENHIQGPTQASVHTGLYYNNELVGVMTFGRKRMGQGNKDESGWELSRFCTQKGLQIVGGAERLLNHFISAHPNVSSIYSFSSHDISNGNLYKRLGFTPTGDDNMSYWYVDPYMRRFHRSSFTKSAIVKMGWKESKDGGWTEGEVMREHGYYKIYDSGQTKWEMNLR